MIRIKAIANSLLAIRDSIIEKYHIDYVLDGLPQEYNPFVIKYMSGNPKPLTLFEVEAFLYVQETKLDKFRK